MGLDFFERSVEYAEAPQEARPARRLHDPDQRHAARRRVGGVLQGQQLSRRPERRRPARDARRLSRRQGRAGHVRRRDARLGRAEPARRRRQHPLHACTPPTPTTRVEVYRFFRDELKTQFIQFIPIVERVTPEMLPVANGGWGERGSDPRPLYLLEGNEVTDRSVTPEQWGRFLIGVFDEWVRRDVGKVYVQMFDAALASWVGAPPRCASSPRRAARARARAQRRPVLVRPLRRAEAPARQHPAGAHAAARHVRAAAAVRPRQARHAAEVLPRVHGAVRLPRRVPEEPLHRRRPTASRGSTTSAPATRRSSRTSIGRCG